MILYVIFTAYVSQELAEGCGKIAHLKSRPNQTLINIEGEGEVPKYFPARCVLVHQNRFFKAVLVKEN